MENSRTIIVNEALNKLFESYKISTNGKTYCLNRLKGGTKIILQVRCRIEPYTFFNNGNAFYSMGAFSYSLSLLDSNCDCGRYVSIAGGVSIVGPNHPYSRFTNSTITYNNLPVFKNALNDLSEPDSVPFPSIPRNLPDLKVTIMDYVGLDTVRCLNQALPSAPVPSLVPKPSSLMTYCPIPSGGGDGTAYKNAF